MRDTDRDGEEPVDVLLRIFHEGFEYYEFVGTRIEFTDETGLSTPLSLGRGSTFGYRVEREDVTTDIKTARLSQDPYISRTRIDIGPGYTRGGSLLNLYHGIPVDEDREACHQVNSDSVYVVERVRWKPGVRLDV